MPANAASGFLLFLRMENVSALSGDVAVPLYEGIAARFQSFTTASSPVTPYDVQRKLLAIATWPPKKAWSPPPTLASLNWASVMMKWSFQMPSYMNFQAAFQASGITTVLPSSPTSEPAPK